MAYDDEAARKFNADVGRTSITYYWRDGTPGVPYDVMRAWEANRKVADDLVGPFRVSTIWLFIDHGFHHGPEPRPPVLFETMVFWNGADGEQPDMGELEQQRYCTEVEARAGHELIVAQLRQAVEEIAVDPGPSRSADAGE